MVTATIVCPASLSRVFAGSCFRLNHKLCFPPVFTRQLKGHGSIIDLGERRFTFRTHSLFSHGLLYFVITPTVPRY